MSGQAWALIVLAAWSVLSIPVGIVVGKWLKRQDRDR